MKEKNVTNDDLAIMVNKGFGRVDERFDKMATKDDLNDLKMGMDNQFSEVNRRLDNIEHNIIGEHTRRIERLEDTINTVLKAVGLPNHQIT
jgi:archaellum component FlaC